MNNEYNLSFLDVLNEVFQTKGWYQGENFKSGVFLKVGEHEDLRFAEFAEDKLGEQDGGAPVVYAGLTRQRYKRAYTQPEIMRKC